MNYPCKNVSLEISMFRIFPFVITGYYLTYKDLYDIIWSRRGISDLYYLSRKTFMNESLEKSFSQIEKIINIEKNLSETFKSLI